MDSKCPPSPLAPAPTLRPECPRARRFRHMSLGMHATLLAALWALALCDDLPVDPSPQLAVMSSEVA